VQTFFIPVLLPSLNELVGKHWHVYASAKKRWSQMVALYARGAQLEPVRRPVKMVYVFTERDQNRDPSNIASAAIKIIEDALQGIKILPDDSWAWIRKIEFEWRVGAEPGIDVTLWELEE